MSNETKQTISRMKIETVAQVAALLHGKTNTSADSIREVFSDMAEHFDWRRGDLTEADVDAIRLEKDDQIDRIRAFFGIHNCGY